MATENINNSNINDNNIDNLINYKETNLSQYENEDLCKKCLEPNLQHCCNIMVEHKTYLNIPASSQSKIHSKIEIEVSIEKVCAGTVIISGMIHKIVYYGTLLGNESLKSCYRKNIDIPFNCFINIDEANEDDKYEVTGHDLLCTYAKATDNNSRCKGNKSFYYYTEKILMRICVMRK